MTDSTKIYIFTQTVFLLALLGTLAMGLFPALLGGLIIYVIVEFGTRLLERVGVIPDTGKIILLAFISLIIIALFVGLGVRSASYLSEGPESFVVLLQKMADIVDAARDYLPGWIVTYLPTNVHEWQQITAQWLRDNAGHFSVYGKDLGVLLVHIVIGMIMGGMIAIRPAFEKDDGGILSDAFRERIGFFSTAFRRIVFSQVRISALNTLLTGIFLLIALPILGVYLPLAKTMVVITFILGLLPIVGNLMSNTIIFMIGLSVSPLTAVGALAYLIVIHKLEYFFNAHIIGTQIKARAWEILLSMVVMEALFGIAGVIAAPIYYAYLKDELSARRLI